MNRRNTIRFRLALAFALTPLVAYVAPQAIAQTMVDCAALPDNMPRMSFETVSVRPSRPDGETKLQVLPNGFEVGGFSLWFMIRMAFDPDVSVQGRTLKNSPVWVEREEFDVQARVSADAVQEWERRTALEPRNAVFRCALQQLLSERFALKLHAETSLADGLSLTVLKSGPSKAMKPAEPRSKEEDDQKPVQQTVWLPDNQVVVRFTQAPLSRLANFLSSMTARKVEDRTGLRGCYTFTLRDNQPIRPSAEESEEYKSPSARWELKALGLRLAPAKVHVTTLVINHIKLPSSN